MISYSSISHPPIPIYEIGTSGPVGYAGDTGITKVDYIGGHSKVKQDFCPICCGKGKVEKQGWFGIIRLVKCKCKNRR